MNGIAICCSQVLLVVANHQIQGKGEVRQSLSTWKPAALGFSTPFNFSWRFCLWSRWHSPFECGKRSWHLLIITSVADQARLIHTAGGALSNEHFIWHPVTRSVRKCNSSKICRTVQAAGVAEWISTAFTVGEQAVVGEVIVKSHAWFITSNILPYSAAFTCMKGMTVIVLMWEEAAIKDDVIEYDIAFNIIYIMRTHIVMAQ